LPPDKINWVKELPIGTYFEHILGLNGSSLVKPKFDIGDRCFIKKNIYDRPTRFHISLLCTKVEKKRIQELSKEELGCEGFDVRTYWEGKYPDHPNSKVCWSKNPEVWVLGFLVTENRRKNENN
jgi:hypothetical protein